MARQPKDLRVVPQVFQTFSALVILCSVMTFIAGKAWCESRGFWGLELLFSLGEIWTS